MPVLDTTVFVDIQGRGGKKRKAEAEQILEHLLSNDQALATTRVNLAELYVGIELSDDPAAEGAAVNRALVGVQILEFDDGAAREFARVRAELQRRGKLVGDLDILIGAIALTNAEAVVTRNPAHFINMLGLTVIGYGTSR